MRDVRVRGNSDSQIPLAEDVEMSIPSKSNGFRMRAIFTPAAPHSDFIVQPNCSECGAPTSLVGIESERPGYELRTFQCLGCENFEVTIGKAT
jgi:hypothetical protein